MNSSESMHSFSKSNDRLRDCVPLMPANYSVSITKCSVAACHHSISWVLTSSSTANISIFWHIDSVRCISWYPRQAFGNQPVCMCAAMRHVVKMPSQTTTDMWTFEARIFIWWMIPTYNLSQTQTIHSQFPRIQMSVKTEDEESSENKISTKQTTPSLTERKTGDERKRERER